MATLFKQQVATRLFRFSFFVCLEVIFQLIQASPIFPPDFYSPKIAHLISHLMKHEVLRLRISHQLFLKNEFLQRLTAAIVFCTGFRPSKLSSVNKT